MCARIANFIPTFFHCPAEERVSVGVMRAQSLSFGVASNGPVNILTACYSPAPKGRRPRAPAAANEHFGSLNDS